MGWMWVECGLNSQRSSAALALGHVRGCVADSRIMLAQGSFLFCMYYTQRRPLAWEGAIGHGRNFCFLFN